MLRTTIASAMLALILCSVSAAEPDVGCPDPDGFVTCPKIGEVFPRTARSDDANLNDRPCGFSQRGESCNEGER